MVQNQKNRIGVSMTRILATIKGYRFRHFNIRLLVWVCALTILGINVIASATKYGHFEKKQILGFILGLIVMFTASLISYKYLLKYYWVMYIVNLILLIWVKVSGAYRMGAVRWIDFGFFQLQPSEFTKLFLILFFAKYFSKYKDKLNTWRVLLGGLVLFAIPLILVLKQPDLSTSIVICLTFCG